MKKSSTESTSAYVLEAIGSIFGFVALGPIALIILLVTVGPPIATFLDYFTPIKTIRDGFWPHLTYIIWSLLMLYLFYCLLREKIREEKIGHENQSS